MLRNLSPAIFVFLLVVVSILAGPDHRLWGVNHLCFLPTVARIVALFVMLAGIIPGTRRALLRPLSGVALRFGQSARARRGFVIVAVLFASALFWVLPSATLLLGDGRYLTETLRHATDPGSPSFGAHARQIVEEEHVYPAAYALMYASSLIAIRLGSHEFLDGVRGLNALFGVLFVLIPVLFLCKSQMPFVARLVITGLILTSGVLELFLGYVEVYAPLIAVVALFCLTGFGVIAGRWPIWWPIASWLVAAVVHVQALLLVPALLFLVVYRRLGDAKALGIMSGIATAVLLVGTLVAGAIGPTRHLMLPLFGSEFSYGIVSPSHFVDVANEVMLIVPGTPLVAWLLILAWNDSGPSARQRAAHMLRAIQTPAALFAGMLAVPIGLFLWVFRPELGMARDWDLFSLCGVPIIAVAYVAATHVSTPRWDKLGKSTVTATLIVVMVLASTWVLVNANEEMSVNRFKHILSYDATNAGYAYENLSLHFHDKGNIPAEIEALEQAVTFSPNPRYLFKLGLRHYAQGEPEKAIAALRRSLASRPEYDRARRYLSEMFYFTGQFEEMVSLCADGTGLAPDDPYYPFCIGEGCARLGRWKEAEAAFERCMALGPTPEMARAIDDIRRQRPDTGGP